MRGFAAPVLAVLASACVPTTELELPDLEDSTRSLVIAYVADNTLESLIAATYPTELAFSVREGSEVIVLAYDRTLEELNLGEGTVLAWQEGQCAPGPLPGANKTLQAKIATSGEELAFVEVEELPLPLALFRYLTACPCVQLEPIELVIETERSTFVMAESATTALVLYGSDQGLRFMRFHEADLSLEEIYTATRAARYEAEAAYRASDGELFIGTTCALLRGNFATGFREIPFTIAGSFDSLSGSGPGEPFELFLATNHAEHFRYDGQQYETIDTGEESESARDMQTSVLREGPGRSIASGADRPNLIDYRDGVTRYRPWNYAVFGAVQTIAHAGALGTVAGTRGGNFLRRVGDESWTELEAPFGLFEPRVMLPLDEGFLAGATAATFGQIYENWGACEIVSLNEDLIFYSGVALEHGYLLGGVCDRFICESGENRVFYLKR